MNNVMTSLNVKRVACALIFLLILVSVKVTVVRFVDPNGLLATRREHLRYSDLSNKVHDMYSDEQFGSGSAIYSNETLGTPSSFRPLDIRNQSLNAPKAFNLAMVYPMSKDCNCVTDMNGRGPCCVRYYRRPHKMGNIQSLQLLPEGVRDLIRITSSEFLKRSPAYDYRDVVLVRDLYSAVISGYLYHISGRECWLDMYGRPTNFTFRWIDHFWHDLDFEAAPPRNDRNLCRYLVEESTYAGLAMYTQMSMIWFRDLVSSHRYSAKHEDAKRTLFVCFGDLEASQPKILDHFFPGGHEFKLELPPAIVSSDIYGGGHSTSRNASLRGELRDLLVAIDNRQYSGALRKMNQELGCADD
ncbi:hypothetical protein MPSEU_001044600 [Mayamaea pseudoterrestris]|nr:hypothetical protein MPSEU_001044600 [Mayamaea pseudoterrestris]